VPRQVPRTTNNITRGIINFLPAEGHVAVRINVQGQWDEKLQRWRKSGSTVIVLDIACTLAPVGRTLVVDTKNGGDKLSAEQTAYMQAVIAAGGFGYAAEDIEDFKAFYYREVKPKL